MPGIQVRDEGGLEQGYDHFCTDTMSQLRREKARLTCMHPAPSRGHLGPPPMLPSLPNSYCQAGVTQGMLSLLPPTSERDFSLDYEDVIPPTFFQLNPRVSAFPKLS